MIEIATAFLGGFVLGTAVALSVVRWAMTELSEDEKARKANGPRE